MAATPIARDVDSRHAVTESASRQVGARLRTTLVVFLVPAIRTSGDAEHVAELVRGYRLRALLNQVTNTPEPRQSHCRRHLVIEEILDRHDADDLVEVRIESATCHAGVAKVPAKP